MKGHQVVSLASASPRCAIPYVANVDAGTVEWIRGLGVEVVSSAELIQIFEAKWTSAQLELHLEAGRRVDRIRHEAFEHIRQVTRAGQPLDEYGVQQFVMRRFQECGLVTNCADFHVSLSKCAKTSPEAVLRWSGHSRERPPSPVLTLTVRDNWKAEDMLASLFNDVIGPVSP